MENFNQERGKDSYQDMQCIWMKSNLVDYKLCDRFFDCDNCLFDKIMRNPGLSEFLQKNSVVETELDILDQKINMLHSLKYLKEFNYLPYGLLLKKLFNKTYYLGLSPAVSILLDNVKSFHYRSEGLEIFPGERLIDLSGEWGTAEIDAPVYFHFCGDLTKVNVLPDIKNWIGVVEAEPAELESAQITDEKFYSDIEFYSTILKDYKKSLNVAGITLNDGGSKVTSLFKAIGKENFNIILDRLIK